MYFLITVEITASITIIRMNGKQRQSQEIGEVGICLFSYIFVLGAFLKTNLEQMSIKSLFSSYDHGLWFWSKD